MTSYAAISASQPQSRSLSRTKTAVSWPAGVPATWGSSVSRRSRSRADFGLGTARARASASASAPARGRDAGGGRRRRAEGRQRRRRARRQSDGRSGNGPVPMHQGDSPRRSDLTGRARGGHPRRRLTAADRRQAGYPRPGADASPAPTARAARSRPSSATERRIDACPRDAPVSLVRLARRWPPWRRPRRARSSHRADFRDRPRRPEPGHLRRCPPGRGRSARFSLVGPTRAPPPGDRPGSGWSGTARTPSPPGSTCRSAGSSSTGGRTRRDGGRLTSPTAGRCRTGAPGASSSTPRAGPRHDPARVGPGGPIRTPGLPPGRDRPGGGGTDARTRGGPARDGPPGGPSAAGPRARYWYDRHARPGLPRAAATGRDGRPSTRGRPSPVGTGSRRRHPMTLSVAIGGAKGTFEDRVGARGGPASSTAPSAPRGSGRGWPPAASAS